MFATVVVLAALILTPVAYGLWMLAYAASPQRTIDRRLCALTQRHDR
jgi:hypothetical protein